MYQSLNQPIKLLLSALLRGLNPRELNLPKTFKSAQEDSKSYETSKSSIKSEPQKVNLQAHHLFLNLKIKI